MEYGRMQGATPPSMRRGLPYITLYILDRLIIFLTNCTVEPLCIIIDICNNKQLFLVAFSKHIFF